MLTTYRDMKSKIERGIPFKGASVFAVGKDSLKSDRVLEYYRVYSYNTLIYEEMHEPCTGGRQIKFDNRFYSMTTRKIQWIIKQCLPPDFPLVFRGPRGGLHPIEDVIVYDSVSGLASSDTTGEIFSKF